MIMSISELDQAKAEEFAERMVGILNEGSIALMTSFGGRSERALRARVVGCHGRRQDRRARS